MHSVLALPCVAGTFSSATNLTDTKGCALCPLGHECGSAGLTAPSPCRPGSHAPVEGSVACTQCMRSTYQDEWAASSCKSCPAGKFCLLGSIEPLVCAAGFVGGVTIAQQSFASCAGRCPAGKLCPTSPSLKPLDCPRGSYCPEGSIVGVPCPAGTYGDAINLQSTDQCTACPQGHECPLGSAVPSQCTPGSYAPTLGSLQCLSCPAGYVAEAKASTMCKPCEPGNT